MESRRGERTVMPEPEDRYQPPALVDLAPLEELTRGAINFQLADATQFGNLPNPVSL